MWQYCHVWWSDFDRDEQCWRVGVADARRHTVFRRCKTVACCYSDALSLWDDFGWNGNVNWDPAEYHCGKLPGSHLGCLIFLRWVG